MLSIKANFNIDNMSTTKSRLSARKSCRIGNGKLKEWNYGYTVDMPGPHILWLLHRVLLAVEQKKVAGWHSPLVYLRQKVEGHNKEAKGWKENNERGK